MILLIRYHSLLTDPSASRSLKWDPWIPFSFVVLIWSFCGIESFSTNHRNCNSGRLYHAVLNGWGVPSN